MQKAGSWDSTITTYTRNFNGDITAITFPTGSELTYNYDGHGWLRSVINSLGDSIHYNYDSLSNRIKEEL
ncbi:MAG: hypothetical protein AB1744_05800 [Candidatus Zixiibacteriota bacterium]